MNLTSLAYRLENFVPKYKLKRIKRQQQQPEIQEDVIYPKVDVSEVYQLKAPLKNIIAVGSQWSKQSHFDLKDCRELVQ